MAGDNREIVINDPTASSGHKLYEMMYDLNTRVLRITQCLPTIPLFALKDRLLLPQSSWRKS